MLIFEKKNLSKVVKFNSPNLKLYTKELQR